jgi:hypothetical protein
LQTNWPSNTVVTVDVIVVLWEFDADVDAVVETDVVTVVVGDVFSQP